MNGGDHRDNDSNRPPAGAEPGRVPGAARRRASTPARVVVLGDTVLDIRRWGPTVRRYREAPAPAVDIERVDTAPGAAANIAAGLAALGAQVELIGLIGTDPAAATLRATLEAAGVGTTGLYATPGRATAIRNRVVAGDRVLVRYDEPAPAPANSAETAALRALLDTALRDADALLVGDHSAAVSAWNDRLRTGPDRPPLLIVDTHRPAYWCPGSGAPGPAATHISGRTDRAEADTRISYRPDLGRGCADPGTRTLVVTREGTETIPPDGVRPASRTRLHPVPGGRSGEQADAFVAALALALMDGTAPAAAGELARAAVTEPVRRPGIATRTQPQPSTPPGSGETILDPGRLCEAVARERRAGARIVFTNGCFDVLHAGHIAYLEEAARLGDVLVVAVNSDSGVRRLKGPDRPVNSQRDRCAVLAALSCVDHITVFDTDTPADLLRSLRPDLYVKGGDYRPELLPETPVVHGYGGEVRTLGYLADRSTSATIERIRGRAGSAPV
ncbi:D-glycero-beta-D-manno-heptose 1-phosphate adenylyltransferase [Nocardia sp. X0981]